MDVCVCVCVCVCECVDRERDGERETAPSETATCAPPRSAGFGTCRAQSSGFRGCTCPFSNPPTGVLALWRVASPQLPCGAWGGGALSSKRDHYVRAHWGNLKISALVHTPKTSTVVQ